MNDEHQNEQDDNHDDHDHELVIFIDKQSFEVEAKSLTGAQLRALPTPPIGPDRDLYEELPGGEDKLVGDDTAVKLKKGMEFFTAPHSITPGR